MEQIISAKPTLQDRIASKEGLHDLKACVALMSSGTMSFAFALAGIPGVIAYKAHPITYLIGKLLVKVPYLGMANLLLSKEPTIQGVHSVRGQLFVFVQFNRKTAWK